MFFNIVERVGYVRPVWATSATLGAEPFDAAARSIASQLGKGALKIRRAATMDATVGLAEHLVENGMQ
jgi:hypothetical protein